MSRNYNIPGPLTDQQLKNNVMERNRESVHHRIILENVVITEFEISKTYIWDKTRMPFRLCKACTAKGQEVLNTYLYLYL